jgi:general stress protein 26
MRDEAIRTLQGLLKGIKFAMLTTVAEDGSLRSRPMAVQESEFDGDLWFFTEAGAGKVDEVQGDHHVNVVFADPDAQRYISVSGLARVVRDPVQVRERWSSTYKSWFPKGVDDPSLALLRVTVTAAEYWESPSSPVVRILGFAKAMATGQRQQPGQSTKLDLERSA